MSAKFIIEREDVGDNDCAKYIFNVWVDNEVVASFDNEEEAYYWALTNL